MRLDVKLPKNILDVLYSVVLISHLQVIEVFKVLIDKGVVEAEVGVIWKHGIFVDKALFTHCWEERIEKK